MFRIFKYVPKVSPIEQAQYRAKQLRKNAVNKLILSDYRGQIVKAIKSNNDMELLVICEQMCLEELTLEEIAPVKNMDIDKFMDNYKKYAILGFINCCY